MLAVIPFCRSDVQQALDLLKWIGQLGNCPQHSVLLVTPPDTAWYLCLHMQELGSAAFRDCTLLMPERTTQGWPQEANILWKMTAQYCHEHKTGPWLWLEPDAIPLKPNWLDLLQAAYSANARPFMGAIITGIARNNGLPATYMNAVAVYPEDAIASYMVAPRPNETFDFSNAARVLPHAANTPLIQCIWGKFEQAPVFAEQAIPGTHVFCLNQLHPEAVLFHRNKDGSLLRLLQERDTRSQIELVYVYVANHPQYEANTRRFLDSYFSNPAGCSHQTVIACNAGMPPPDLKQQFDRLPFCRYLQHDNSGFDIGAFQKASRESSAELMVFCGSSAYIRKPNWLARVMESYQKHGDALYGTMGHRGVKRHGLGQDIFPHIRTTGFWIPRLLFNQYPIQVTRQEGRYAFEHGVTCLTEWIRSGGLPALVVTQQGEYEWKDWDSILGGYQQGDQRNLLIGDRMSMPPFFPFA